MAIRCDGVTACGDVSLALPYSFVTSFVIGSPTTYQMTACFGRLGNISCIRHRTTSPHRCPYRICCDNTVSTCLCMALTPLCQSPTATEATGSKTENKHLSAVRGISRHKCSYRVTDNAAMHGFTCWHGCIICDAVTCVF